jgi:ABC-2 type transport system ATP-binding protein
MTSTETFEFLAHLLGATDVAYRDQLVERFKLDSRKKIRALSKGNRQKVQLIAALATRADLLLLDEPTSGLDPLMEMAFRRSIEEAKERGQTVFLSSHILSEVEAVCDRVGILRGGRLVDEGTLEELRHLAAQTVEVTFEGGTPELPALPGVKVASAGPNALRFEVAGSVGPLVAALAAPSGMLGSARLRSRTCSPVTPTSSRSVTATPTRPSRAGSGLPTASPTTRRSACSTANHTTC